MHARACGIRLRCFLVMCDDDSVVSAPASLAQQFSASERAELRRQKILAKGAERMSKVSGLYRYPKASCDATGSSPRDSVLERAASASAYSSSAVRDEVMCRICHTHAGSEQAETQWLVCSVSGCCAGYAVCDGCVRALHQAPAAVAAGEGFSSQVNHAVRAAPVLWLTSAAAGRLAAVLAVDARAVWRVARPPDDVAV